MTNLFLSGLRKAKGGLNARILGVISALVVTFVVFTILEPSFISTDILLEIGVQSTIIAFVGRRAGRSRRTS